MKKEFNEVLDQVGKSIYQTLCYKDDEEFLKRIANLDPKNRKKVLQFKNWDWFQGVGLYGWWKIYKTTNDSYYLNQLKEYYNQRIEEGIPDKNINSVCPMLTMACLYEELQIQEYAPIILEWATWIMEELPRTREGGFVHVTSESSNDGQMWDDTLFMTVLFLAKAGALFSRKDFIEEALFQFMIHTKYLSDSSTGLWYHGWNSIKKDNYAKALWGRGNSWITIAIPELIEILSLEDGVVKRCLLETLTRHVEALAQFQAPSGLWHTIVNEDDNYEEASASAGFAYGILKSVHMGLVSATYKTVAMKALEPLMQLVDDNGMLQQVSIGTPMGSSVDFYKTIGLAAMPYGQAALILYLCEVAKDE